MATQLGNFIPDLSHMLSKLRPLLKKDVAWTWTQDHENDFTGIKKIICSKSIIHPFDPRDSTRMTLLTDTSRLHGIGFALLQISNNNQTRLVQCGSAALTPTQAKLRHCGTGMSSNPMGSHKMRLLPQGTTTLRGTHRPQATGGNIQERNI